MYLQSVLFSKNYFNKREALKYCNELGYNHEKIDETENFYRFRQIDPDLLRRYGFNKYHTKQLNNGVDLIFVS